MKVYILKSTMYTKNNSHFTNFEEVYSSRKNATQSMENLIQEVSKDKEDLVVEEWTPYHDDVLSQIQLLDQRTNTYVYSMSIISYEVKTKVSRFV